MNSISEFLVRPACAEDEQIFFRWRNEPWIVRGGASQRSVEKEEHHNWFQETLTRQQRELSVVEIDREPAGMVRYDWVDQAAAEISIYLLPAFCGKGYGRSVFFATAPDICARRGIRRLTARILAANVQSQEFFRRLGFRAVESLSQPNLGHFQMDCGTVPHSRPSITERELTAVVAVLESGQISGGPKVQELEQRWCTVTGVSAASAVGSGLGALRLALLALDVGPGAEVIMPAYSCVALMNAGLALGATPVLADVIPDAWTLSVEDVRRRLTKRTKAIIAVHLFGAPAPVDILQSLGIPIVEDCAHGIGGNLNGRPFGWLGTLSIASFYATKMLAAGEGGIVAGKDPRHIECVCQARDYGDRPPDGRHLNDKMTDIEAALAITQLDRLPGLLAEREQRANQYADWLKPLADDGLLSLPPQLPGRIWYRYPVRLLRHMAPEIVSKMRARGVKAEQPVWDLRGTRLWSDKFAVTSMAFDCVLSLPLYPNLTEFEQRLACAALSRSLRDD